MPSRLEAFKAELTPDARAAFDALTERAAYIIETKFGGKMEPLGRAMANAMPFLSAYEQTALTYAVVEAIQDQATNAKLMKVQLAMQRENQVFTAVSNVMKTRHDTVKNSIGNIK